MYTYGDRRLRRRARGDLPRGPLRPLTVIVRSCTVRRQSGWMIEPRPGQELISPDKAIVICPRFAIRQFMTPAATTGRGIGFRPKRAASKRARPFRLGDSSVNGWQKRGPGPHPSADSDGQEQLRALALSRMATVFEPLPCGLELGDGLHRLAITPRMTSPGRTPACAAGPVTSSTSR